MMVRKKKKRFSATKAVKSLARDRVGSPKATVAEPASQKQKKEKYKVTLEKLLTEE